MADRPPIPGIPRRHLDPRREPERPAVPPPEPSSPTGAPAPVAVGKTPSVFAGPHSRAKEYAILIGAITAGVASIATAMRPAPESATSVEVAQLRSELAKAKDALSSSEIGQIKVTLDSIEQRLDLWQKQRDAESAADGVRDTQIRLLAELGFRLNGGSPMAGFPRPGEGVWEMPNSPPPQHRTGQSWRDKP